jgi:hypothetical protein
MFCGTSQFKPLELGRSCSSDATEDVDVADGGLDATPELLRNRSLFDFTNVRWDLPLKSCGVRVRVADLGARGVQNDNGAFKVAVEAIPPLMAPGEGENGELPVLGRFRT